MEYTLEKAEARLKSVRKKLLDFKTDALKTDQLMREGKELLKIISRLKNK